MSAPHKPAPLLPAQLDLLGIVQRAIKQWQSTKGDPETNKKRALLAIRAWIDKELTQQATGN